MCLARLNSFTTIGSNAVNINFNRSQKAFMNRCMYRLSLQNIDINHHQLVNQYNVVVVQTKQIHMFPISEQKMYQLFYHKHFHQSKKEHILFPMAGKEETFPFFSAVSKIYGLNDWRR